MAMTMREIRAERQQREQETARLKRLAEIDALIEAVPAGTMLTAQQLFDQYTNEAVARIRDAAEAQLSQAREQVS